MYKQTDYYTLTKASNGIIYYYAYDRQGRRIRRSTGCRTKQRALIEINRRISEGTLYESQESLSISRITFAEFSEPFWIWESCPIIQDKLKRGGHYSLDLCISNRQSMEKHILPYFRDKPLGAITRKDVDRWILHLPEDHGISASTANKMLSILKQMLRVAVYDGLIPESPAETVKPLIEKPKRRGAFTMEEVSDIFSRKWDSEPAYVASFIAAFTGMRLGEIRALRMSKIYPGYILVDSSWSDRSGMKCTKSGKSRIITLTKRMYSLLASLAEGRKRTELIFSADGITPYDDKMLTEPLKDVMERIGIDYEKRNLTFHSFRHFFNTQVVASGLSGEIVRNVVGHESEEMTDHYLHLEAGELEAVRDIQLRLTGQVRRP